MLSCVGKLLLVLSTVLAGAAGKHEPEAIRRLILQLVPTGSA